MASAIKYHSSSQALSIFIHTPVQIYAHIFQRCFLKQTFDTRER